jgi:hypothetical protein
MKERTETRDSIGDIVYMEDVNSCASDIVEDVNSILRNHIKHNPDCLTKMLGDEAQDKMWELIQTRIDILLDFPEYKIHM